MKVEVIDDKKILISHKGSNRYLIVEVDECDDICIGWLERNKKGEYE